METVNGMEEKELETSERKGRRGRGSEREF